MNLSPAQMSRLSLRSARAASEFSDVALPELPAIPGMISPSEARYLYWLTSRGYCGAGAVVEVGTWLGRSTSCLAAGLRDAGHHDVLHCFDKFAWTRQHGRKAGSILRKGESFQAEFEGNVRPVYPRLRVTQGAIQDLSWDGGPIEILFLDAPKRLEDISAAMAVFGPSLVPGLSLIVLQDYLHEPSYALAAVISCLPEALEPVHVVERGTTVSFLVRAPLDYAAAQPIAWNFTKWDEKPTRERWEGVLSALPDAARARLDLGILFLLHDQGWVDEAVRLARGTILDADAASRWKGFSETYLYRRYKPIFRALGVRPSHWWWQSVRGAKGTLRKAIKRRVRSTLNAMSASPRDKRGNEQSPGR